MHYVVWCKNKLLKVKKTGKDLHSKSLRDFLEKMLSPSGWEAFAVDRYCKSSVPNGMKIKRSYIPNLFKIFRKIVPPGGLGRFSYRQILHKLAFKYHEKTEGPTFQVSSRFLDKSFSPGVGGLSHRQRLQTLAFERMNLKNPGRR